LAGAGTLLVLGAILTGVGALTWAAVMLTAVGVVGGSGYAIFRNSSSNKRAFDSVDKDRVDQASESPEYKTEQEKATRVSGTPEIIQQRRQQGSEVSQSKATIFARLSSLGHSTRGNRAKVVDQNSVETCKQSTL